MKKTTLEKVSEDVVELLKAYPISLTEPKNLTIAQSESLARMFGDNALRDTLETLVRIQNKNLIAAGNEHQHIYFKARIDTLMQLLVLGKTHFITFEMLRSRKKLTDKERFHELEKQLGSQGALPSDISGDERLPVVPTNSAAHPEAEAQSSPDGTKRGPEKE